MTPTFGGAKLGTPGLRGHGATTPEQQVSLSLIFSQERKQLEGKKKNFVYTPSHDLCMICFAVTLYDSISKGHTGDYSGYHECSSIFTAQKPCRATARLLKVPKGTGNTNTTFTKALSDLGVWPAEGLMIWIQIFVPTWRFHCLLPPPPPVLAAGEGSVVCYFGSWATWRPGDGKFDVEDIDPFLCTHLIFGFAGLSNHTWEIEVSRNSFFFSILLLFYWFCFLPSSFSCFRSRRTIDIRHATYIPLNNTGVHKKKVTLLPL